MQIEDTVRKGVFFLGWKEKGRFVPRATAFIVSVKMEGYRFFYAATAQHCIGRLYQPNEKGDRPQVYCSINRKDGAPEVEAIPYEVWYFHPNADEPADVAVSPIAINENVHDVTHRPLDEYALTEDLIRSLNITIGDQVFVVGLFRNHYGRSKNIPVVRIGNISAMPEEPISSEFGNVEGYLVECRSIGGLSGSPVFVDLGMFRRIGKNVVPFPGGKTFYLLGLMHGHFDVKDLNLDVVLDDQTKTSPNGVHSGIGIVVPASKIVDTVMQEDLMIQRKKSLEAFKAKSGVVLDVASKTVSPATDENPTHQEDFKRLLDVAARKPTQDD